MASNVQMKEIVSLAKRRGFIFQGSEIYGGLANTYDFGPLGVSMLRKISDLWWKFFVKNRHDMFGLDTSILMSPKVWEGSGHTQNFTDVLIDCKSCKLRTRADHLVEDHFKRIGQDVLVEGKSLDELDHLIDTENIRCPKCGNHSFTKCRKFNLLFETRIGIVEESQNLSYLRGEIAQGMFVNFRNVLDTMRPKLPFGIAQFGKAFRNEITLGNSIYRTLEFNLAEFEYFFDPKKSNIDELFEYWKSEMETFLISIGLDRNKMRWRPHSEEERAHYSLRTEDLEFEFPFGYKELLGLAYRTDYDLRNHSEKSGVDLSYTDPENNQKFIPHVIEPTFGINRILLALLTQGLRVENESEESERLVLGLSKNISPYLVAVFPLVRNKPEIVEKAEELYFTLKRNFDADFDSRGNIGKRYLTQDEIGTPYCITVDYQTLEDNTVTIRDRDTKQQERVLISNIVDYITK